MSEARTVADRLLEGDRAAAAELARRLLKPRRDNLVERPWGGDRLVAFKSLAARKSSQPYGESFEICADDGDDEARRYPSVLPLADGSTISLAALLAVHGDALLGRPFVERYGRRFPLLPKLLDVAELLSVQAHPPGNTEVYVILDAAPGATIRLGFAAEVDAGTFATKLAAGRRAQQRLLELVGSSHAGELQSLLKPWLERRAARPEEAERALCSGVRELRSSPEIAACLATLHEIYWFALDALNAVPVKAGDVIYNANPAAVAAARGIPRSAEVHALGNPEGRWLLALEIRRPGPTFRAWDNVRFPVRDIDIEAALHALNLGATSAGDFIVEPRVVRPGVRRSVDGDDFRLEHLAPTETLPIDVPASAPHCLHALAGRVEIWSGDGRSLGTLERGESALVPAGVGAYRLRAGSDSAELVRVSVPPYGD